MLLTYRSEEIHKKANRLARYAETRDPLLILKRVNVHVTYLEDLENMLGMYTYQQRERCILLNNKLDEYHRRMVAAHELGHDALHREDAKAGALKEIGLMHLGDRREYEADAFAAHLLIEDDLLFERADEGFNLEELAYSFRVDPQLMLIKMQEMNRLYGCHFDTYFGADCRMMDKIGTGDDDDWGNC